MAKKNKNPKKPIVTENDYVKACGVGKYETNKDNGFKAVHKAHKSYKDYSRKPKHKQRF